MPRVPSFSRRPGAQLPRLLCYDSRYGHAHWLYQHKRRVFLPPVGKAEQWTLSSQHTAADVEVAAHNVERFARDLRG